MRGGLTVSAAVCNTLPQLIAGAGAVLLQREIPEAVNTAVAQAASAAGVPVLLDAGGVDAPLSGALLQLLTAISPNETELQRLTGQQADSEAQVVAAAAALQQKAAQDPVAQLQQGGSQTDVPLQPSSQQQQQQQGAVGGQLQVLVKRGSAGSLMVGPGGQQQALQPAIAASRVVDTTGKGSRHLWHGFGLLVVCGQLRAAVSTAMLWWGLDGVGLT